MCIRKKLNKIMIMIFTCIFLWNQKAHQIEPRGRGLVDFPLHHTAQGNPTKEAETKFKK
jgi:hypothetical protein